MYRFHCPQLPALRSNVLLYGALLCLAVPTLPATQAAEEFKWSSSLERTSLAAGQNKKPLLVIDLAGEVTAEPFTSPMGRLLEATTFSDPRVVKMSRRRFEVVCRQHGATHLVKRHVSKREQKTRAADFGRSDNVVFYFCTPDARVLHMATGFLPADELLQAAALAERLMRETQLERGTAGQVQAVRGWHVTCADRKHLVEFERLCAVKREEPQSVGGWDSQYVRRIVAAAAQVHAQELKVRLANHWQGAVLEQTVARLTHHGEVATNFAHLVLSKVPLVALDTLDRICFEAVTGQRFLSITSRRKALYGWFLSARRQRQPIMFVIDDNPFVGPPVNELSELLIWQPKNSDVRHRLDSFAAVQVTAGELAALLQDAVLSHVTLSKNSRNWLLYDRQGDYVDVIVSDQGARLSDAMKLAAE